MVSRVKGRKEERKLARQHKKERKQENYAKRHGLVQDGARKTKKQPRQQQQQQQRSAARRPAPVNPHSKRTRRDEEEDDDEIIESDDETLGVAKKENKANAKKEKVKMPRQKAPEEPNEDDLEIMKLEKLLGLNKKSKEDSAWGQLKKGIQSDGFDAEMLDFLKDADGFLSSVAKKNVKKSHREDEDADEDDLSLSAEEDDVSEDDVDLEGDDDYDEESEPEEHEEINEDSDEIEGEQDEKSESSSESAESESDDERESFSDEAREEADPLSDAPTTYLPERGIYGDSSAGEDKEMKRLAASNVNRALDNKVRSLLNRCSEENAGRTVKEIDELFNENPPAQVVDSIARMTLNGASPATCFLSCGIVLSIESSHSGIVGQLLESIAKAVHSSTANPAALSVLGALCAMNAVTPDICFQIIPHLEGNEEALLALLQTCGWRMRALDPAKFRSELMNFPGGGQRLEAHAKSKHDYSKDEERARKWRRFAQRECKDGASIPPPLNVPFEDLVHAEATGRWWVLGASWKVMDAAKRASTVGEKHVRADPIKQTLENADKRLLSAAETHSMDTDIRKALFCLVMSGEDYVSTFDSITKLGLGSRGDRDVIKVIFHCCLKSKRYNPFFGLLLVRLCSFESKYKFSAQLAFWDELKHMDSPTSDLSKQRIRNTALFLAELILQGALSLITLKAVDFTKVASTARLTFLKELFMKLLLPSGPSEAEGTKRDTDLLIAQTFTRLRSSQDGVLVRDGILVFWSRTEPFMSANKTEQPLLYKRLKMARNVMEFYVKGPNEDEDDF